MRWFVVHTDDGVIEVRDTKRACVQAARDMFIGRVRCHCYGAGFYQISNDDEEDGWVLSHYYIVTEKCLRTFNPEMLKCWQDGIDYRTRHWYKWNTVNT